MPLLLSLIMHKQFSRKEIAWMYCYFCILNCILNSVNIFVLNKTIVPVLIWPRNREIKSTYNWVLPWGQLTMSVRNWQKKKLNNWLLFFFLECSGSIVCLLFFHYVPITLITHTCHEHSNNVHSLKQCSTVFCCSEQGKNIN